VRTLCQLLAVVFIFAFKSFAGGQLNTSKVDWRIADAVENGKVNKPNLYSHIFSKYSQAGPVYSVIVHATSIKEAVALGIQPRSFNGKLFTAFVTHGQLIELSNASTVSFIAAPRKLYPKLDKSIVEMKADKVHTGQVNGTAYKGNGVIVGVIDSGIDWKHQDFRKDSDTTKTRIRFLWDQTDARNGVGPAGYNYGAEYDSTEINNELDGTPANAVLEEDIFGHGTHVASIAAGDGSASGGKYKGVAPEADIIIVKAGDGNFDSDKIIDGITYIRQKAAALGRPFVINLSLGGHDGAHDGTSAEEITIDQELADSTGRQVVIAAGDEGADSIHADGTVTQGSQKALKIKIPSYSAVAGSQNDYVYMSAWYKSGDNLTFAITTPNNTTVSAASGQTQESNTAQGYVQIKNAKKSDGVISDSERKECAITLVDFGTSPAPASGEWTVTVTGSTVTAGGTFDIWIAGSSITSADGDGVKFTTGVTAAKLVGMPGTVEKGITVGAYVTKWRWQDTNGDSIGYLGANRLNNFSTFSSMGPTRDGRQKPDVSAPGQGIAAALSISSDADPLAMVAPAGKYVINQGTSMASPHVAGLVALMLQAKPSLTAAEIRLKLNAAARKDAYTGATVNAQWGNGKADAAAAMQNVLSVKRESGAVPKEFVLKQNYPNPFNPATKIGFKVQGSGFTSLKVYDILGREVATLVNETLEAGEYSVSFDATNVTSGVYFYTLKAGNHSITKKMLLLRSSYADKCM